MALPNYQHNSLTVSAAWKTWDDKNPWTVADVEWFTEHPQRDYRLRRAFPDETIRALRSADDITLDDSFQVVVRQKRRGVHLRIAANFNTKFADDENMLEALFDMLEGGGSTLTAYDVALLAKHSNKLGPRTMMGNILSFKAKNPDKELVEKEIGGETVVLDQRKRATLMQSSAEFVAGFSPPDYLIDGLIQRRYVYSFTGPTGSGKTAIALRIAAHVAIGLPLAGREVVQGRALMFAGENPDDVRTRWIKLCEVMGKQPSAMDMVFMPLTPDLSETEIRARIDEEATERGPFSLLIVDTSASYYTGNDENDNVALGNHARLLRSFVNLPGGPTILVTCHPTKTPNMESLLPRGGGAFLAEVDGNLVAIKERGSMVVEISTHGKFRGPEFAPFSFKLVAATSTALVDTRGRSIWTVYAEPISSEEQELLEEASHHNENELLRVMLREPGRSLTELATKLHWLTIDKRPNKPRVQRMMENLKKAKLVELRRDGHYVLTSKGEQEAAKSVAPARDTDGYTY